MEEDVEAVGHLARMQRRTEAHRERISKQNKIEESGETYVLPFEFSVNQYVWKPKGYPFEGTVVGRFTTLTGKQRYVVESRLSPELLHIFSENQLEAV